MDSKLNGVIVEILEDPKKYAKSVPVEKLVDILKIFSHHYYHSNQTLIPDEIYDILMEVLEDRDPNNPYLDQVGAPVVSKDLVKLPYAMPSLDKIKPGSDALVKWIGKYKGPYVLSDKLDGISGLLYKTDTVKLYTRGESVTGQDISHLVRYLLKDVDLSVLPMNTAIRGEIIMSKENFETIKDKYKNARNTVAGLVNSKHFSKDIANLCQFIGYAVVNPQMTQVEQMNMLKKWNFPTVEYKTVNKISEEMLSELFQNRRENGLFEIDGIVVIDGSIKYNNSEKNPEHGFAFKMRLEDQMAEAVVKDVEWNISKHGMIKPRIIINPVKLVGVDVKYATAFNAKYVFDNKLGPGAIIKIVRSGDVIPYILSIEKPAAEPKMPDVPYEWNKTGVDIIVKDFDNVDVKNKISIKEITSFFKVLDVKFISEGIVTLLVDNGYDSVYKILTADKKKLAAINGMGDKIVEKVFKNIKDAFSKVTMEVLMHASNKFGIGLGTRKLKVIINNYPNILEEQWSRQTMIDKIIELDGFENVTATRFTDSLDDFKKFYNELLTVKWLDLTALNNKTNAAPTGNLFAGQKIIFTGFRNKEMENFIISNGGQMSSSVSKNTSLLVYADGDTTSSKFIKAGQLGTKTMSLTEFKNKYKL